MREADLFKALKLDTAKGKQVMNELLESLDGKTAEEIIQGVQMPPSIKELYSAMYHYTSDRILIDFAEDAGNGIWKLDARKRWITPSELTSESTAQDLLQLPLEQAPNGTWAPLPGKGRFRAEIQTSNIQDSIKIPQADLHSGQSGVRPWVQPVVKDNPVCGAGGLPQFTADGEWGHCSRINMLDRVGWDSIQVSPLPLPLFDSLVPDLLPRRNLLRCQRQPGRLAPSIGSIWPVLLLERERYKPTGRAVGKVRKSATLPVRQQWIASQSVFHKIHKAFPGHRGRPPKPPPCQ